MIKICYYLCAIAMSINVFKAITADSSTQKRIYYSSGVSILIFGIILLLVSSRYQLL